MLIGDIITAARTANYIDADGSVMLLCDGSPIPGIYGALIALIGPNLPQFGRNGATLGYSPVGASPAGGIAVLAVGGAQTHGHTIPVASTLAHNTGGQSDADAVANTKYQVGAVAVAAAGHHHSINPLSLPGDHTLPKPDDANWITPVLGTGFFIKAA